MKISAKEVSEILPKDCKIKEKQNPSCNNDGHFCGIWRGVDSCVVPLFRKDKDGNMELFKFTSCKKTGLKGFEI